MSDTTATPSSLSAESVDLILEAKLERYLFLQGLASEFKKLKEELKPAFEGTESITIGGFCVTGKYVTMPEKKIPSFTYWDMRIKPASKLEVKPIV